MSNRHRLTIDAGFNLGDFVVLRTDPDDDTGLVIGINLRPSGVFYGVSWHGHAEDHYEMELRAVDEPPAPLKS